MLSLGSVLLLMIEAWIPQVGSLLHFQHWALKLCPDAKQHGSVSLLECWPSLHLLHGLCLWCVAACICSACACWLGCSLRCDPGVFMVIKGRERKISFPCNLSYSACRCWKYQNFQSFLTSLVWKIPWQLNIVSWNATYISFVLSFFSM